ncbi:hypothetical protein [Roseobacter weihaiensis]|uniref:hypothetical protein n=1 Tax=Roseobacter weihaiensis TaxID=2763262 RepID=UPI001D09C0C9|nr:hypothetical protein [Roseobacter sp. H9]
MHAYSPISLPTGAALEKWATRVMDVILHIGAHRTGTASFQAYMRSQSEALTARKIGFWGPKRTRRCLYDGLVDQNVQIDGGTMTDAGQQRMQRHLSQLARQGIETLVVSDADMMGTVRSNLSSGRLYADAGPRIARLMRAFEGHVTSVVLSIRSLELYWCSALAHGVSCGHPVPERSALRELALAPRGWRDVIADVAAAAPQARISVHPFEAYRGQPELFAARAVEIDAPRSAQRYCLNRSPQLPDLRRAVAGQGVDGAELPFGMGRWNPFTTEEHAALRELYADDMMWLTAGAEGLATLIEESHQSRAGKTQPSVTHRKGQFDELEERHMARPG